MDNQLDTTLDFNLNDEILRDLLDSEVVLIGGGEFSTTGY
jgi:hypothetical protein